MALVVRRWVDDRAIAAARDVAAEARAGRPRRDRREWRRGAPGQQTGAVNGHHERTLRKIFQHPISTNLGWREVEHLLDALGADAEETSHGHLKVRLNGQTATFEPPRHKDLPKDEVIALRHFLQSAGVAEPAAG